MEKIVVTGANGQLGQELQQLAKVHHHLQFVFLAKDDLDISDAKKAEGKIADIKPSYLINCAAYTAVDKAETEKETAFAINAKGAKNLARACHQYRVRLIHVSTDYVFDGKANLPYQEDSVTNPLSVYGQSKLEGERYVREGNSEAIIIRTSWVYSYYGNNFVKTMMRLMQSREQIGVVSDQYGSPTHAADIAAAILQIIEKGKWQPGTYHYTNDGEITWYQFAQAIKELIQSNCIVNPITTQDYPTPAARPSYSVLSKEKFVHTFSIELKPWKDSLRRCLHQLTSQPQV